MVVIMVVVFVLVATRRVELVEVGVEPGEHSEGILIVNPCMEPVRRD